VLAVLARVTDLRRRRGVRHRLTVILDLAVCAVLAGARSFTAIAEWAADADRVTLDLLGVTGAVPSESTFRRALQRLDADAFDDLAGQWAQQRTAAGHGARRVIAVDGKTLRGSGHGDQDSRHLLAALDHAHSVVLGQAGVEAKTNEITVFCGLLDRIDIQDAVITADAMHAQHSHARYLAGRDAHYLLTVKKNQPLLHAQVKALPWRQVPAGDSARASGHGRLETRTLKAAHVARLDFPHARQAIKITRRREDTATCKVSRETAYAITSLTSAEATAQDLARLVREHWSIEAHHHIRDVTFHEDTAASRSGCGPVNLATIRAAIITAIKDAGYLHVPEGPPRPHHPCRNPPPPRPRIGQ
jgi:predicted transposase YbfD/YdcC